MKVNETCFYFDGINVTWIVGHEIPRTKATLHGHIAQEPHAT